MKMILFKIGRGRFPEREGGMYQSRVRALPWARCRFLHYIPTQGLISSAFAALTHLSALTLQGRSLIWSLRTESTGLCSLVRTQWFSKNRMGNFFNQNLFSPRGNFPWGIWWQCLKWLPVVTLLVGDEELYFRFSYWIQTPRISWLFGGENSVEFPHLLIEFDARGKMARIQGRKSRYII